MGLPNSISPLPGSSRTLRSIGHTWLTPLYVFVDYLVSLLTVNANAAWAPVRLMTASGLGANTYVHATQTKTANANGAIGTIDGVTPAVGDRIWDKNAGTGSEQGLFVILALGSGSTKWSMKRAPDADLSADFVNGRTVQVGSEGTANANTSWALTNTTFVLDTTTPALATENSAGALTVAGVQTNVGTKSFTTLTLAVWNAAKTFVTSFATNATAARVITFPDASATMAQAGVASGGTAPAWTSGGAALTKALNGATYNIAGAVLTITAGGAVISASALAGATIFDIISGAASQIIDNTLLGVASGTITIANNGAGNFVNGQQIDVWIPNGTVASHTHNQI